MKSVARPAPFALTVGAAEDAVRVGRSPMRKPVTAGTPVSLEKRSDVVAQPTVKILMGSRPTHVHTCNAGEIPHTWECNSPYCEFLESICPGHGGNQPVEQGREPWRGR